MGSDQGSKMSTQEACRKVRPHGHCHGSQCLHVRWSSRGRIACWPDRRNVAAYNELHGRGVAHLREESERSIYLVYQTRYLVHVCPPAPVAVPGKVARIHNTMFVSIEDPRTRIWRRTKRSAMPNVRRYTGITYCSLPVYVR